MMNLRPSIEFTECEQSNDEAFCVISARNKFFTDRDALCVVPALFLSPSIHCGGKDEGKV